MNFGKYVKKKQKLRAKLINEFFELPENILFEMFDLGKTKIVKEPSTGFTKIYSFKISDERYKVTFSKDSETSYMMGFTFEEETKYYTGITDKRQASRVYAGLLDTFKIFIEKYKPEKVMMYITFPKKAEHFSKVIKIAFKKYNNIFGDYEFEGIRKENIDDTYIIHILTIKRKK